MELDKVNIGFYTLADIKVNTILCGKHGWSANAMESGSEWTNKPRYRVAGVTNRFFVLEDSYLGGKEEIIYIDSDKKQEMFVSNFRVVKIQADAEDFIFNPKCAVYDVIDDVRSTWTSRKGQPFTYKSTYEVKFNYKNYGFILFRAPKLDEKREKELNYRPIKSTNIKNSFGSGSTEFVWYFTWNQTFSDKTPWKCPEKIQERAIKFMFFIWDYFKDGYSQNIKQRQSKEPIVLLAR